MGLSYQIRRAAEAAPTQMKPAGAGSNVKSL
jgi:hypothetical protein